MPSSVGNDPSPLFGTFSAGYAVSVMASNQKRLLSVFAGLLAVTAFFILSSIAVVWANGLKFNPETKRFEQTVVIAVESEREHQAIAAYLNGELVAEEIPFQLRGLLPGNYELLIQQNGFQPHVQNFWLSAGEVKAIREYQPIAVSPKVTIDSDRAVFTEPLFETGLRVTSDGELIDKSKLITRFIATPLLARRIGTAYIYQVGSELRLFLPEGPHDYLVYQLANSEPAKINIRSGAWQIILQEGETVKLIELTKAS